MPAINDRVVFCVSRLRSSFLREGQARHFHGTGFWIEHRGHSYFVTNRHNVDPDLKFEGAGYSFDGVEIELREWKGGHATPNTQMFPVVNPRILVDPDADCCLIVDPDTGQTGPFSSLRLPASSLADATWLAQQTRLMDRVHFIGYPLSPMGNKPWWDTNWATPIAREASIASLPFVEFENPLVQICENTKISDIVLVSGHSFGGCSGSPVIHTAEDPLTNKFDARIIGIMSGHLGDKDRYDKSVHGGLSYFTRATSIWRILQNQL